MNRVAFRLQVRPERMDEYRRHHAEVWPEMCEALQRHGWHNYTLFLDRDGTLFGYFETPTTLDDAVAGMGAEDVNRRWQELMAPFFEGGEEADHMMQALPEIFHLD